MAKDTKNKSMGWLKGVLTSNQSEQHSNPPAEEPLLVNHEESESHPAETAITNDRSSKKFILSKENLDKVSLDLVISVENMLNDRQLVIYKNEDLENQLQTALETIERLKNDIIKKEQLIEDKNKEIDGLENTLTSKQMSYDQLLDDYKEYQETANINFEKVSAQLEKKNNKYELLKEESAAIQDQHLKQIRNLEERIRELEADNKKLEAQCTKVLAEKAELMQTINEFTERMFTSFSPKPTSSE